MSVLSVVSFAGQRGRLGGAVALGVLSGTAGIALTAMSAWLLSRAAEHPPVMYLMVAIVSVRAFGLSRGVFRYLERLVGHDGALGVQADLRQTAYARLARSTWLGRRGDLLARLVLDIDAVQDLVVRVLLPFTSAALVVVATTTVLSVLSPAVGLLVLASALVAGALLPWLAALGSRRADTTLAPLRSELATLATEAAATAPDLVAYGATDVLTRRLRRIDEQLRRAESRAALVRGVTGAGQVLAGGFAVAIALLVGGRAVVDQTVPPVQLVVLVLTPLALHEALAGLPAAAQIWTRTRTALARVAEILHSPPVGTGEQTLPAEPDPTDPDSSDPGRPALTVAGATLAWGDDPPVVVGLDLTVRPGERVCLTGPSGSGKTTVAAAVMGLIPVRAGAVTARGRVGYLAQDAYIFDTTVAENVRIGRREATDEEVAAVLSRVGLDLAPDRLVGEHGTALSGGEARRVGLARLLLDDYPVLIIDEPTEHLDQDTATRLLDDLWAATAEAATLFISHDPALAERCDRVVALSPAVTQSAAQTG